MKIINQQKSVVCSAFVVLIFVFGSVAAAQTTPESGRIRIAASPTPTVRQTPPPGPTPSPKSSSSPQTAPTTTPRVQILGEMQSSIRAVLNRAELQRARVGVKIVSLDSGKTIFEENAERYFMPASNMKSFTVATALDRLTPNFRFVTSVYAAQKPDANGAIRGDLTVYGRGDPTFAAALNEGDYYRAINALADKIASSGVRRIEGNLIGDESYFSGDALGQSWEWDDLQWYYGAGVSALTVNDNAVDLKIFPGSSAGSPCVVQILPANTLVSVVNTCTTRAKREIAVTKRLGTNILEIRGTMSAGDSKGYSGAIALEKPAEMFVFLLKNALAQRGVVVTGQTRTIDAKTKAVSAVASFAPPIEIARLESPPLGLIAAKTLKPSQNLYTELILRALGEQSGDKSDPKKTSAERGLEVVQKFLIEAGIESGSVVQWDGSGLSRHNLITPAATAQLYSYMSRHRFAAVFNNALPVGAIDGTLRSRFKDTAAANNVRAKTGTIDQVSTLSGYLTTASGERLAFSILINNLPGDTSVQRSAIDSIVLTLANFNGKSQ